MKRWMPNAKLYNLTNILIFAVYLALLHSNGVEENTLPEIALTDQSNVAASVISLSLLSSVVTPLLPPPASCETLSDIPGVRLLDIFSSGQEVDLIRTETTTNYLQWKKRTISPRYINFLQQWNTEVCLIKSLLPSFLTYFTYQINEFENSDTFISGT